MTYIPEISQSATTSAQATKTDNGSGQTLGQEQFLTLLIAQMQNQDPLNPTDSTEWTSQLAQYSQLEQSINLNAAMEDLVEGQKSSERLAALSLIGKEAVVEGDTFSIGEAETEIGYRVDGNASDIRLHIQNSDGHRVATLIPEETTPGNHFLTWQGLDKNGDHLPPGRYTIVVEAVVDGEGGTAGVTPLIRSEITGVDMNDDGALLLTDTGEVPLDGVHGVYEGNQTTLEPVEKRFDTKAKQAIPKISAATDGAEVIEEPGTIMKILEQLTAPGNS